MMMVVSIRKFITLKKKLNSVACSPQANYTDLILVIMENSDAYNNLLYSLLKSKSIFIKDDIGNYRIRGCYNRLYGG
jgi:hypothetical protein